MEEKTKIKDTKCLCSSKNEFKDGNGFSAYLANMRMLHCLWIFVAVLQVSAAGILWSSYLRILIPEI